MVVATYRVSVFDQFVVVIDWPGTTFPRRWAVWDLSGPSGRILDHGQGDPPARFFPLGIVPTTEAAD